MRGVEGEGAIERVARVEWATAPAEHLRQASPDLRIVRYLSREVAPEALAARQIPLPGRHQRQAFTRFSVRIGCAQRVVQSRRFGQFPPPGERARQRESRITVVATALEPSAV